MKPLKSALVSAAEIIYPPFKGFRKIYYAWFEFLVPPFKHSILYSLWPVSDRATPPKKCQIMTFTSI